jgi:hypothetical protein
MRSPLKNIDKLDQPSRLIGGCFENFCEKERTILEGKWQNREEGRSHSAIEYIRHKTFRKEWPT